MGLLLSLLDYPLHEKKRVIVAKTMIANDINLFVFIYFEFNLLTINSQPYKEPPKAVYNLTKASSAEFQAFTK